MRINPGDTVVCGDGKSYDISHRTDDNYMFGMTGLSGSQRLFKPNGHYAGSNKERNVTRIV